MEMLYLYAPNWCQVSERSAISFRSWPETQRREKSSRSLYFRHWMCCALIVLARWRCRCMSMAHPSDHVRHHLHLAHRLDTANTASASIRVIIRVFAKQNIARIWSLVVSNCTSLASFHTLSIRRTYSTRSPPSKISTPIS